MEFTDKIEGFLDLSLCSLEEVPLKDMSEKMKNKVKKLDLSNNLLVALPATFPKTLTGLVELDLSKNKIQILPENFGLLVNLVHLDLYSNKISKLPLSFKDLGKLKWLDLKDNPLMPELAKVAGPCVDQSDCMKCAKGIVSIMQHFNTKMKEEEIPITETETVPLQPIKEKKKKKKTKKQEVVVKVASSAPTVKINNENVKLNSASARNINNNEKLKMKTTANCYSSLKVLQRLLKATMLCILLIIVFICALIIVELPASQPYLIKLAHTFNQLSIPQHFLNIKSWLFQTFRPFLTNDDN